MTAAPTTSQKNDIWPKFGWWMGQCLPQIMYISLKLGVFGINKKIFENAREWCPRHSDILQKCQVIQVSNLDFFATFW